MSSDRNSPRWPNASARDASVPRPSCHCLDPQAGEATWQELKLHTELQDTACAGWTRLLELIEDAARDGREEFSPLREMTPEQWIQLTTLPPSIARLKAVKHFILYGSSLVRIPPEIGGMSSLEEFTPYTSYRLHWFPYEITRCRKLKRSTVSTRALYGNAKFRPPFPRLPQLLDACMPTRCSICDSPFGDAGPLQYWVSLRVATDVLPLLVHACSRKCLARIPEPHQGGLDLQPRPPW